jgi:hypothetical protein
MSDRSDQALERMAGALEKLVAQDALPTADVGVFLSSVDPGQLEAEVTKRMKAMRGSVFLITLEVLGEWAADG